MSTICETQVLPNVGQDCKFEIRRLRRLFFVSTLKEDGTPNKISIADAALIDNWQALFDKYNFSSSVLERVVPSPLLYDAVPSIENENTFNQDTYMRKLYKGDSDVNFNWNDIEPSIVDKLQALENLDLSVWIIDDDGFPIGKKVGTDFYPFLLSDLNTANWQLPGDNISQVPGSLRFAEGSDLNKAYKVEVLDSSGTAVNMASSSRVNVWSLLDVTVTTSNDAVTGCTFTAVIDKNSGNLTTITYDKIAFVNQNGVDPDVTLAGAGSLTYNSETGVYTVNEAGLFTAYSGDTFKLQISVSKFDCVHSNLVTAP